MNIIVHLPNTKEGWDMLSKRMVEIHSEFIINEINNLPYSYEKKLEILEGIKQEVEGKIVHFQYRRKGGKGKDETD
ncbi:hypothetical protein [Tepidimicrobium xylanilyticum]|uniref:hypothetical protein n=1 Tax=Tepidimicrobium xylanilyticum TaxID=1123352 RepID=UPI00265028DE|nr:hypothetical protein [Tepidimicrobium xylanilyticum]GMG96224.1 hypothetical protein EN5CB1_10500 [Tepidimicrobium xylanilyticum]